MTKKAFIHEYGDGVVSEVILMDELNDPNQHSILERLGVLEISRRRLEFIRSLDSEIGKRETRTGEKDLEEWM